MSPCNPNTKSTSRPGELNSDSFDRPSRPVRTVSQSPEPQRKVLDTDTRIHNLAANQYPSIPKGQYHKAGFGTVNFFDRMPILTQSLTHINLSGTIERRWESSTLIINPLLLNSSTEHNCSTIIHTLFTMHCTWNTLHKGSVDLINTNAMKQI